MPRKFRMSATGLEIEMSEFHPFIQDLIERAEKNMGAEALQESVEDDEFIIEIIGEKLIEEANSAVNAVLFDVDPLMASLACCTAAIHHYRMWLLDRGVDVRELEGRQ